jgi:hypothetical protein
MISHLTRFAVTALALVGFAGSAHALATTLNDCDAMGCEGSTLFLSVEAAAGGGFDVIYTIDTTNYYGDRLGFNQVGFKAISGWTTGTVTGSPVGSLTDWNPVYDDPISVGPPDSDVCQTSGGDNTGWVCIQGFVNAVDTPGEYTWTFHIDDGTLMTDTSEWSLGGQYANGGGRTPGKILSAEGGDTPLVPEPTAALLFGLGAILVTRRAQRR